MNRHTAGQARSVQNLPKPDGHHLAANGTPGSDPEGISSRPCAGRSHRTLVRFRRRPLSARDLTRGLTPVFVSQGVSGGAVVARFCASFP
jgi:hypothetical protein